MNQSLKQCSLCENKKHIGFINYYTKERYRLCTKHYYDWMFNSTIKEVDQYVRFKLKQEHDAGQTKLIEEKRP